MNCYFCRIVINEAKIYFRDECPSCGRDLHGCRNCFFYDPGAYQQCREPVTEPVRDKEKANYCDYFRPAQGVSGAATGADPAAEAKKKLEDLFKK